MNGDIVYRQELKFRVSRADRELLLCRLSAAMHPDKHGKNGVYTVRTLYFDTVYDDALRESLAGDPEKVKFRLRMYNADDSFLRLEKKIKQGSGGTKVGARLTRAECEKLLAACGRRRLCSTRARRSDARRAMCA